MRAVVPFPLPQPLAIISIHANWQIALFGQGDSAPLGVLEFATVEQATSRVFDLFVEDWRLVFTEGTSGVSARLRKALQ